MATWTLENIKTKVNRDLDTQDETFVSPDEMTDYVNEAVREAEAEIHKLGVEDEYFLAKKSIPLVQGTAEYDMPTDIYANKIRGIYYENGTDRYMIKRIKGTQKFAEYHDTNYLPSQTEYYKYIITNDGTNGIKLELVPSVYVAANMTVWYVRNVKELSLTTDVCDIPEFINFIFQYVKVRVYEKEVGHPSLQKAMVDLEKQRALMVATLTEMVPDGDNLIEQDSSFYEESV